MTQPDQVVTGGCLCGALRYEAQGVPDMAGFCCCADCRKASGSGYIGFMMYPAARVRIRGQTASFASPAASGGMAVRSSCPHCHSLVLGGVPGVDDHHTLYAGSLDDPTHFRPSMGLFNRDRPDWVCLPEGLDLFETMPDRGPR